MAEADDTSNISDSIWLRDAFALAKKVFGGEVLAAKRLTEWLAAGDLPWCCMSWEGPDAETIARLNRENEKSIVLLILPSAAYHEGDSRFWRAPLTIDWEDNAAREFSVFGARALGIRVSREHLLGLLERDEAPRQTKPAHRKLDPKTWLAKARKKHPRQQNEPLSDYVGRLYALMLKADVTAVWKTTTLRRRLYDD